jgi:hypothetical protein
MRTRRVSPDQLATWIRRQGRAVTPVELRARYGISDATLRRRREELARLGVVFVEAGRRSHYQAAAPVFDPDAPPPASLDVPEIVDPVEGEGRLAFVLDELRLPDGRTIREAAETDPWIISELLRPVFQTDEEGLPLLRLVYDELGRGHGKSLYAAAFAVAEATLHASTEIICAAADVEQALIILQHIDGFVERSPMLQALVERGPNVRLFAGGSRVRVISSDSATAWGLGGIYRRFRVIADELTVWREGRGQELWEALASATGKVADAQTLILSNAGWNADRAWQHKIRGTAEREPWARLYSPEGTIASWISPKWIAQQRSLLPPAAFERVILNRWVSQEGDFVSAQQLDACTDSALARVATGAGTFFGGIDLGLTKDRTALCIVQHRHDRFELAEMQVWQGTRSQPVSIEQVERAIIDACERFPGLRLYADKWQFENSLQRLRGQGVQIDKFEFSPGSVQRLSESLYRSITSRTLALPAGEIELRRELLGLITKETPNGWRFDHRSGGFSDQAVALAMAVHLAEQKSRRAPMSVFNPNAVRERIHSNVPSLPTRTTDAFEPLWRFLRSKPSRSALTCAVTLPPGTVIAHAPSVMEPRRKPTTIGGDMTLAEFVAQIGVHDGQAEALALNLPGIETTINP